MKAPAPSPITNPSRLFVKGREALSGSSLRVDMAREALNPPTARTVIVASDFPGEGSSMAAFDPFRGFNMYGAAKAAVNLFTKATADEGKRINLNAVAVGPGAVETDMLRDNFSEKAIPKDMTLDPAEVAAVLRDCITGDRDFEPGETILLPSH